MSGERGRFAALLDQFPAIVAVVAGPQHVIEFANPMFRALTAKPDVLGHPAGEVFDEPENRPFIDLLEQVYGSGESYTGREWPGRVNTPSGESEERFFDFVFVPLRTNGEVRGVLVHAVDVTGQVVARQTAEESRRRFETLVDANVVGVAVLEGTRFVEANDALLNLIGYRREELETERIHWSDFTPPEWHDADERAIEALLDGGRVEPYEKEYVARDGRRVPVLVAAVTLSRQPFVAVAFFVDLTERKAAAAEVEEVLARERESRWMAELASARARRLQEITAELSAAISPDEIARVVVHQAVEDLSAAAGTLVTADGSDVVIAHSVGYGDELTEKWQRFPLSTVTPVSDAMRAREIVTADSPEELRERYPYLKAKYAAMAAVPLVVRDEALGAIGLSFAQERTLTSEDRDFLRVLAAQAALALERARLYEERSFVARTLQQGLLPEHLAEVPGLVTALRYESISDGGEVGGDFYDLFDSGPDRWTMAVGDVCGKGTTAAVVTGLARHTLRAIAQREERPSAILSFLNDAIRRHSSVAAFCTVGCAVIEPGESAGRFVVRLASGGHPYPLLVRPGRPVAEVKVVGTMLGVDEHLDLEEVTVELEPGDLLVFYTDGVIDTRRATGERFGEPALFEAIETGRGGGAEGIAAAVEAALQEFQPGTVTDDRALLVLEARAE